MGTRLLLNVSKSGIQIIGEKVIPSDFDYPEWEISSVSYTLLMEGPLNIWHFDNVSPYSFLSKDRISYDPKIDKKGQLYSCCSWPIEIDYDEIVSLRRDHRKAIAIKAEGAELVMLFPDYVRGLIEKRQVVVETDQVLRINNYLSFDEHQKCPASSGLTSEHMHCGLGKYIDGKIVPVRIETVNEDDLLFYLQSIKEPFKVLHANRYTPADGHGKSGFWCANGWSDYLSAKELYAIAGTKKEGHNGYFGAYTLEQAREDVRLSLPENIEGRLKELGLNENQTLLVRGPFGGECICHIKVENLWYKIATRVKLRSLKDHYDSVLESSDLKVVRDNPKVFMSLSISCYEEGLITSSFKVTPEKLFKYIKLKQPQKSQ